MVDHWRTISEAPRYRIDRNGVVVNKHRNKPVRQKLRSRYGRYYVALNTDNGTIERYVDDLLAEHFGS